MPEIPTGLLTELENRRCVLFTGAGLSAQAGLPTWKQFARQLVSWAQQNRIMPEEATSWMHEAIQEGVVDPVVHSVATALGANPAPLHDYLRRTFLHPELEVPEAYTILTRLPFQAALTSNYDDFLERAFNTPSAAVLTPRDARELLIRSSTQEFYILKLYGSLERPESLILSPQQSDQQITSILPFSQYMEGLLVNRTLFFVGLSLDGILNYLRSLKIVGSSSRTHYALTGVSGTGWRANAILLKSEFGIEVLPYEVPHGLVESLREIESKFNAARMPAPQKLKGSSKLRRVTLENIGPFDHAELNLTERWNILLGPNGVGKSTILRAIATGICGTDASPFADRLIKAGRESATITLATDTEVYKTTLRRRTVGGAGAEVTCVPTRPLEPEGWVVLGFPPLRTGTWGAVHPQAEGVSIPVAEDVLPLVRGEVDPRSDKLKQWIVNIDYRIKAAQALGHSPDVHEAMLRTFFEIVTQLSEGVCLKFGGVDPVTKQVTVKTDDGPIPIELVSQGMTSLLSWIGVLVQRIFEIRGATARLDEAYALVLMDEIDAHMHPAWQQMLAFNLQSVFPKVQFLASTHSPLIVAGMAAEEIFVVQRDPETRRVALSHPTGDLKGLRADQILTSPAFGLALAKDPDTTRKTKRMIELARRTALERHEQAELEELSRELGRRAPSPGETQQAREAFSVLEQTLNEKLSSKSPNEKRTLLNEVELQIQEALSGKI
jgi:hypothetical protein